MEEGELYRGIFNYCNSGVTTWYEFASAIKNIVNSNCLINPIPTSSYTTAAKRPQYSALDTEKIKKIMMINIPSWEGSLKKCLAKLSQI
jgi:dTDP-4-dehydrorhamnose reductase